MIRFEDKWVVTEGYFLSVLVRNHSCKIVQNLGSQVVAPKAEHDDNTLGLLLAHRSGHQRLVEKSQGSLKHFADEIRSPLSPTFDKHRNCSWLD